jgi:signal recognition particle GTPase
MAAWQQVRQQTIQNCFRKAKHKYQVPFHYHPVIKWQTMMMISAKTGKNCVAQKYDFQSYVSVDRHVARSGVETVEELCEAFGSTRSVEEEDENEQEMVPRLTKFYKKLKRFHMRTVEATRTVKTF